MKSKSTSFILVAVALVVVGVLIYFFVIKGDDSSNETTGLVSTTTGQSQGLATNVATTENSTGSQVVAILRNLTAIKLDDSVFRNPAFVRLNDNSITLLPATNQGRRNPFAPVDGGINAQAPVPGGF